VGRTGGGGVLKHGCIVRYFVVTAKGEHK
jgi:hypothetical protein